MDRLTYNDGGIVYYLKDGQKVATVNMSVFDINKAMRKLCEYENGKDSIVRCKDCKLYNNFIEGESSPNIICFQMHENDFCSYGQRKEKNEKTCKYEDKNKVIKYVNSVTSDNGKVVYEYISFDNGVSFEPTGGNNLDGYKYDVVDGKIVEVEQKYE